jgi:hypothetical protein
MYAPRPHPPHTPTIPRLILSKTLMDGSCLFLAHPTERRTFDRMWRRHYETRERRKTEERSEKKRDDRII